MAYVKHCWQYGIYLPHGADIPGICSARRLIPDPTYPPISREVDTVRKFVVI